MKRSHADEENEVFVKLRAFLCSPLCLVDETQPLLACATLGLISSALKASQTVAPVQATTIDVGSCRQAGQP